MNKENISTENFKKTINQWIGRNPSYKENSETIPNSETTPDELDQLAYKRIQKTVDNLKSLENDSEIQYLVKQSLNRKNYKVRKFFSANTIIHKTMKPAFISLSIIAIASIVFIQLKQQPEKYLTQVGERRLIQLDDGSNVELNTDSQISIYYTKEKRLIELHKGEAVFSVEKDPNRPFIVDTQNGSAQAIGTVFNVLADQNSLVVTVLSGTVAVKSSLSETLKAGNNIEYITQGEEIHIKPQRTNSSKSMKKVAKLEKLSHGNIQRISNWRKGKFQFKNEQLKYVINEINRYNKKKLVIQSPKIEELKISGSFRVNDLDGITKALKTYFNIKTKESEKAIFLYN